MTSEAYNAGKDYAKADLVLPHLVLQLIAEVWLITY